MIDESTLLPLIMHKVRNDYGFLAKTFYLCDAQECAQPHLYTLYPCSNS